MAGASPGRPALLRVGDLAERTGTTPRMLRYYEGKGLIRAERSASGQRLFSPETVEQVGHIRMLLAAGLPTSAVQDLLTCIRGHNSVDPCAVPVLLRHLREYDERIAGLTSTRAILQGLIGSATPLN
ncbi:MerR family transcriptional regulator [Arthrobacter sp. NPDC090010]|uniref:MerR family transcriptional regulator n=1 Tax=Arthrobacter sp. NPDC090010 TaxID=3363942 RepID=UPI003806A939